MKINVFRTAISLDDEEDVGIDGIYQVIFDEDYTGVPESKLASMALDLFHTQIAIACLDDFEITVLNDQDEPIAEDESHESYSFKGNGFIEKVADISLDLYGDDAALSVEQLDCKYNPDGDGEHPKFTRDLWREAVGEENTSSGYWDWVKHALVTEAEKAQQSE